MTIGSKHLREGIQSKTKNISSVFRVSGLWYLSFTTIDRLLELFKYSGIALSEEIRIG